MSPGFAVVYILTIVSGPVRVEVISNPGLTAIQCHQAGEDWLKSKSGQAKPGSGYECRPAAQTINSK